MKIGLLSDTHSDLDPKIFEHFSACDEIWHGGDIGDRAVIDSLMAFKPVRAVYGNIDDKDIRTMFPENARFQCEGLTVLMTHIGGKPSTYNARVKKLLSEDRPDIFVCGHSHLLLIRRDPMFGNMLFINPGAAGNHGFHRMKTIVRFDVRDRVISNMEVIELGKRGALTGTPQNL